MVGSSSRRRTLRIQTLFSFLGLCHSLCTMAFHSLGIEFPYLRVHSSNLLISTFLFFQKVRRAGLLESFVAWWVIRKVPSSFLNLGLIFTIFIYKPILTALPQLMRQSWWDDLPCMVNRLHHVDRCTGILTIMYGYSFFKIN